MVAPMETDLMLAEANKLDVDVLCWGGTHRFDAYEYENKFFVNPGSATGAFCSGWVGEGEGEEEGMVPSFCLMDVSCFLGVLSSCLLGRWERGDCAREVLTESVIRYKALD